MDKTIRLRGRLKQYIKFTLYLGILLLLVNIAVYLLDVRAGVVLSGFVLFYFVITLWLTAVNKRIVTRELINFATEYGQVQRTMIKEFDVPYALLEENGKIVWCNDSFLDVVGSAYSRNMHIHSLFPAITKDKYPDKELGESVDVSFAYEEKEYRARISRMVFNEMLDQEIELEEYAENAESYLLSVFLYGACVAARKADQEIEEIFQKKTEE